MRGHPGRIAYIQAGWAYRRAASQRSKELLRWCLTDQLTYPLRRPWCNCSVMHYFPMLPFVCGLGFRKARALRDALRASGSLISRKDLIDRELLPAKVGPYMQQPPVPPTDGIMRCRLASCLLASGGGDSHCGLVHTASEPEGFEPHIPVHCPSTYYRCTRTRPASSASARAAQRTARWT